VQGSLITLWWRQYAPLKRRSTSIWLHSSISQKTVNFIFTSLYSENCSLLNTRSQNIFDGQHTLLVWTSNTRCHWNPFSICGRGMWIVRRTDGQDVPHQFTSCAHRTGCFGTSVCICVFLITIIVVRGFCPFNTGTISNEKNRYSTILIKTWRLEKCLTRQSDYVRD
jgi:hypothetical protein